jgi:hypothetical protein
VVATLPPEQIGRQIVRLVARLELPPGEVSDLVVDAVTHPSRHGDTRSTVASPRGTSHQPPPVDHHLRPQAGETAVPAAVQRARAGFPAPLTLQSAGCAAAALRPASPAASAPHVSRHA